MDVYKFDLVKFRLTTAHLDRLERSVFRDLIDLYYSTEKPLTANSAVLEKRLTLKTNEEKIALNAVLEEFFTLSLDSQRYHLERCDSDIVAHQARLNTARANGKRGGRPKASTKSKATVAPLPEQNQQKQQNLIPAEKRVEPVKTGRFSPPSLREITEHFVKNGIHCTSEPEKFFNFYESKNWYVGKNKMKNWKAAVAGWITRSRNQNNSQNNGRYLTAQEKRAQRNAQTFDPQQATTW